VRNEALTQVVGAQFAFPEEIWVREEDWDEASRLVDASQAD
jgi:hypothetical protein